MFSPVTPIVGGMMTAGFAAFSVCVFVGPGACEAFAGCAWGGVTAARLGLACRDVLWRYWRSSESDMAPATG